MTETPRSIKEKLKKELDAFLFSSTYSTVAKRAGVSYQAVKMFFETPARRSPNIDKAAFELLAELKKGLKEKINVINS